MIDELLKKLDFAFSSEGLASRFQALIEEVGRLDPRDFTPAYRFEFVTLRRKLKNYSYIKDDDLFVVGSVRLGQPHPNGRSGFMSSLLRRVELSDAHGVWADHPNDGGCGPMAFGLVNDTKTLLSQLSTVLESYLGLDARTRVRSLIFAIPTFGT
jgi:hypothetical protein